MPRTFLVCLLLALPLRAAPTPAALAAQVDAHLAAAWAREQVRPAPRCADATFVRRVYLDLVGRIPTPAEVRDFTGDRPALVARLVRSPAHARHQALFWRRQWVPQADTPRFAPLAADLDDWLTRQVRAHTPYDRLVRDLLLGAPAGFLSAGEFKPENLAANTTRAFLGINLDCAQCHNHPFARWTREQFWETAAFFTRDRRITVPDTNRKPLAPRLLNGQVPQWPAAPAADSGRQALAVWVTARANPYFARNAVNRLWADLLGTGLVEPLDDLSDDNPASQPRVLDDLAAAFAASGFDLRYLTETIVLTRAYQLASVGPASDPSLFARAAVRGLTGEQLYDSLRVAAGLPPQRDDLTPATGPDERQAFAARFRIERSGTAQRSILQSLALMNGPLTDPKSTPTLRAVVGSPFLDARGKVTALYLAALGRKPGDEAARVSTDAAALADLFWALLNSTEFSTNH